MLIRGHPDFLILPSTAPWREESSMGLKPEVQRLWKVVADTNVNKSKDCRKYSGFGRLLLIPMSIRVKTNDGNAALR
jgi:hypothetical protein